MEDYVSGILDGHSGKTMSFVTAIRSVTELNDPGLASLRASLESTASAASRNRLARQWLSEHRDQLDVALWASLGLLPSSSGDAPTDSRVDRRAASRLAVFDFDCTLTSRHLHLFQDPERIVDRVFGGADRVGMLQRFLGDLRSSSAIVIVTRNSKHTVRKALAQAGLLEFITGELIFGFEDYSDDIPKSEVVAKRVMPATSIPDQESVIFVDDDPANVRDVRSRCPGISVVQAPRDGLTSQECEEILAWARRPP